MRVTRAGVRVLVSRGRQAEGGSACRKSVTEPAQLEGQKVHAAPDEGKQAISTVCAWQSFQLKAL